MKQSDIVEILIVEDNPNDAEMALRALKKNNLRNNVLIVSDGEEALDFIFKKINILIMNTTIIQKLFY